MTSAREFVQSLPRDLASRELAIFAARDLWYHDLQSLTCDVFGRKLRLQVSEEPLMLGDARYAIVANVSAYLAQRITDALGCVPMTARLADLIYLASPTKLVPRTQPSEYADRIAKGMSPSMSDAGAMLHASDAYHAQLAAVGRSFGGHVGNACKHWVATKRKVAGHSFNYGWHGGRSQQATPWAPRVIQPCASFHGPGHVDYSQGLYLIADECWLDGEATTVRKLAADIELWRLVHDEGPTALLSLLPFDAAISQGQPGLPSTRTLREGAVGEDVAELRAFLSLPEGKVFDRKTTDAVVAFQKRAGLTPDGAVGPLTRAAIARAVKAAADLAKARDDVSKAIEEGDKLFGVDDSLDRVLDDMPRQRAAYYNAIPASTPRPLDLVVLHSMEAAEKPGTAEGVSAWFAGKAGKPPQASAHVCVDCDSAVMCVDVKDVAWHAPGANRNGIGVEHAGFARQTEAEWLDDYSEAMLDRSARIVAALCKRHSIPVAFVDREGLKRGERGITTHNEVTFAFRRSDHVDPGKGFPMAWYLERVRHYLALG